MKNINIPLWVSVAAFISFCIENNHNHGLFMLGCAIYMRIVANDKGHIS